MEIILIMLTIRLVLLYFLCTNVLFSQRKIGRLAQLELWAIDNGDYTAIQAHKIASKKWPFVAKVSNSGENIDAKNEIVWKNLEAKGYKNPKCKYVSDFEQEYQNLKRIAEILESYDIVRETFDQIKGSDLKLKSEIYKIEETLYEFSIFSISEAQSDYKKQELKIRLDLSNDFIEIIK